MSEQVPARLEAIRLLREDRERTRASMDRLSPTAFESAGLGGGTWSPKDLVGHLETWEEHALEALEAVLRGEPAPITQQPLDTDELNRTAVEGKAGRSAAEALGSAAATHARILEALAAVTDDRWSAPEGSATERSLADRLGSILGGSLGYFRHDPDHWGDIEAFVSEHAAG